MGKYGFLGTAFDRLFRNTINNNFTDVGDDIDALDSRIDNIVASVGDSNTEIVDARGGSPTLGDRLDSVGGQIDSVTTQLADSTSRIDWEHAKTYENLKVNISYGEDWTACIQTAIDNATDTSNRVILPEGEYYASGLKLPHYVQLVGSGYGTVLKAKDTNNVLTVIYDPDNGDTGQKVKISNIRINGNNTVLTNTLTTAMDEANGNGIYIKFIKATQSTPYSTVDMELLIDDVTIERCLGNGLFIDSGVKSVFTNKLITKYNNKNGVFCLGTDNFLGGIISYENQYNGIFNANENNIIFDSKTFRNGKADMNTVPAGGYSIYAGLNIQPFTSGTYPYSGTWTFRTAKVQNVHAQEEFGNGYIFRNIDSLNGINLNAGGINYSDLWNASTTKLSDISTHPIRNTPVYMDRVHRSKITYLIDDFKFFPVEKLQYLLYYTNCYDTDVDFKVSSHYLQSQGLGVNGDGSTRFTYLNEFNIWNLIYYGTGNTNGKLTFNGMDVIKNESFRFYGYADSIFINGDAQSNFATLFGKMKKYDEWIIELSNGSIYGTSFPNFASSMPQTNGEFIVKKQGNRMVMEFYEFASGNKWNSIYDNNGATGSKFSGWKGSKKGTMTYGGDGVTTTKTIAHGLGVAPSTYYVQKASANIPAIDNVTADATNLTVTFVSAPPSGTTNVNLKWRAEV